MNSFTRLENIRTDNCASKILEELNSIANVSNVSVNIEEKMVSFQSNDDNSRFKVVKVLRNLVFE